MTKSARELMLNVQNELLLIVDQFKTSFVNFDKFGVSTHSENLKQYESNSHIWGVLTEGVITLKSPQKKIYLKIFLSSHYFVLNKFTEASFIKL